MSIAEMSFREEVRSSLSRLDGSLIPVLEALIHHQYPPQVVALQFEVFSDGFTCKFPVMHIDPLGLDDTQCMMNPAW
jgi:hypothetical protein